MNNPNYLRYKKTCVVEEDFSLQRMLKK